MKAGKIRFERTCCILEKLASIFCSSERKLKIKIDTIERVLACVTDLELQRDELVNLVNLISNRGGGVKPRDDDGFRV